MLSRVGWNSLIMAAGMRRSIPCIDQWMSLSPYFFIADSACVPYNHTYITNNTLSVLRTSDVCLYTEPRHWPLLISKCSETLRYQWHHDSQATVGKFCKLNLVSRKKFLPKVTPIILATLSFDNRRKNIQLLSIIHSFNSGLFSIPPVVSCHHATVRRPSKWDLLLSPVVVNCDLLSWSLNMIYLRST